MGFYKEKYTDGDPLYGVTPFKGDEAVKQIGLQGVNPKGYSAEGFPRMDITGYPSLFTQPGGERQNDHDWGYRGYRDLVEGPPCDQVRRRVQAAIALQRFHSGGHLWQLQFQRIALGLRLCGFPAGLAVHQHAP